MFFLQYDAFITSTRDMLNF